MEYDVYVHEIVGLAVRVNADSPAEARRKAATPSEWRDWQEVPDVLAVWVPRSERAAELPDEK